MSTSIWRGPEPNVDEGYPLALLKYLLKQMMAQFAAQGGCIALYDESLGLMKIHAHLRLLNGKTSRFAGITINPGSDNGKVSGRRATMKLFYDPHPTSSPTERKGAALSQTEEFVDVTPQQSDLFAVGTTYPMSQDLIGYTWHTNEAYAMRHEDYITLFQTGRAFPWQSDMVPLSYLAVPIREALPDYNDSLHAQQTNILGIIVLYQLNANGNSFQKQRAEAIDYVERIALYLQNDKLQRTQRRTSEYLQLLQDISNTFPTSVKLSDLVENMHQFVTRVVDVSSMLLTLYDRDQERIYDVFALRDGVRVEELADQPRIMRKEERPVWWNATQQEKRTLHFSPAQDLQKFYDYQELLTGAWGDQQQAESFLLLPMKMFNRVIGSLCLTSMRPHAYHPEEIQVLETMVQIVTVGIENAKLYERDRRILERDHHLLNEARQRKAQLAAINNALQSISSVLNVTELLNNLVESVATLVKVEMCVFFQPTATREELIALALYGLSSVHMVDDGSGLPSIQPPKKGEHDQLINMIRLPFQDTFLEHKIDEGFFYLNPAMLEELAQRCNEGGAIFLRETNIRYMLMIPMSYQKEFIGFLAVPITNEYLALSPQDIGTLLAICAQTASAVRNAQLFEQRTEAYAELERMDKLKDEFLVTASHELRTPLTAISGYTSQLKRQGARANPQQILRFTTKISVAAQQLNNLVANMTEAAQMGMVDKKMLIEPVHLLLATEIAQNMLTFSNEQHVTLDISARQWIYGDASSVRQVLTNLLENAAKYSPPESPINVSATDMSLSKVESLLSEDQADPTLLLEQGDRPVVLVRVQDKGEGIQPEDQLKIFEKFVRAPRSLTTPVRGTGLGLYICRRFVEAMGGKLWLECSVPNEGSTFSFYLPRAEVPVEAGE